MILLLCACVTDNVIFSKLGLFTVTSFFFCCHLVLFITLCFYSDLSEAIVMLIENTGVYTWEEQLEERKIRFSPFTSQMFVNGSLDLSRPAI